MKFLENLFKKQVVYTDSMFVGEIGDLHRQLTELAVRIGKESYGVKLNFTHSSISQVERILDDIHQQYKKTGDTEGLTGIALEFGFYIAATIQKCTGTGVLKRDHPEFGENSFPFFWNESTLFTYGWCEKRILDGPGDDVISKYKVLVLDELNKDQQSAR